MRITRLVPISNIRMDRYPLHPRTLALVKHMELGGTVPPIKLAAMGSGGWRIKDGRHRITASKMLGRTHIVATFSTEYEHTAHHPDTRQSLRFRPDTRDYGRNILHRWLVEIENILDSGRKLTQQ